MSHSRLHRDMSLYHYQHGVNLIEIMVAMAIGLFLVLGATSLYINTKKTSDVDDSIARLQETARYAMATIETDVRMANYWGLKKDGADFENKDNNIDVANTAGSLAASTGATSCGATYATDTDLYIDASNNDYGTSHGLSCAANGTASTSADTLTVRRVATSTAAASDARLQVCSTRKTATMTRSASAACTNGEFHNLVVNGYYIDQTSDQSSSIPSLRRKTLGVNSTGTAPAFNDVEIIPGVEDIQIEIGWDNSNAQGDPAGAVQYTNPGSGPASGRVVAVRVWLLIRAEQPDFSFKDDRTYSYADRTAAATNTLTDAAAYAPNDNFRRLLVSRTFFVRNVTGS